MSNKKQSSVEWLVVKLSTELIGEIPMHRWDEIRDAVQQAKAMHKEEIENAYWEGGQDVPINGKQCQQYYNEKFTEGEQ